MPPPVSVGAAVPPSAAQDLGCTRHKAPGAPSVRLYNGLFQPVGVRYDSELK
jgi:hypothetical protein